MEIVWFSLVGIVLYLGTEKNTANDRTTPRRTSEEPECAVLSDYYAADVDHVYDHSKRADSVICCVLSIGRESGVSALGEILQFWISKPSRRS